MQLYYFKQLQIQIIQPIPTNVINIHIWIGYIIQYSYYKWIKKYYV